jgi:hypothetical protein
LVRHGTLATRGGTSWTCPWCPFAFPLSASSGTGSLSPGGWWAEAASPWSARAYTQVLQPPLHATAVAVTIQHIRCHCHHLCGRGCCALPFCSVAGWVELPAHTEKWGRACAVGSPEGRDWRITPCGHRPRGPTEWC